MPEVPNSPQLYRDFDPAKEAEEEVTTLPVGILVTQPSQEIPIEIDEEPPEEEPVEEEEPPPSPTPPEQSTPSTPSNVESPPALGSPSSLVRGSHGGSSGWSLFLVYFPFQPVTQNYIRLWC